LSNLV